MFKTLLINQLNTADKNDIRKIFFLLGNMDDIRNDLLEVFNKKDSKYYGKITFRYNGISIIMSTNEIPDVIRKLIEMNIDIYSVYEAYEPK